VCRGSKCLRKGMNPMALLVCLGKWFQYTRITGAKQRRKVQKGMLAVELTTRALPLGSIVTVSPYYGTFAFQAPVGDILSSRHQGQYSAVKSRS
jgi:hypothetical protein